jgi:phenylacetate-CoA ligase
VVLTEDSSYRLGQRQTLIPPDACSAVCGLEGMRDVSVLRHLATMVRRGRFSDPSSIRDLRGLVMNNWIERATVLPPLDLEHAHGEKSSVAEYVAHLRRQPPSLLTALPEYLRALARYVARTSDKPPYISEIRPMGANLDAVSRAQIERALGSHVREHYGSLELGGIAFDCKQRAGLHVLADQFIVEVVRDGRPVPPGERGVILITDLHNAAMPLLRYQIGDVGWIDGSPCGCGRTTPRLHLEGRVEDTIVDDDGTLATAEDLSRALYAHTQLDDFQLVEHGPRRFELHYSAASNELPSLAELELSCRRILGPDANLICHRVRSIPPEPSGKFRHCKSASHHRLTSGWTPSPLLEPTAPARLPALCQDHASP